MKTLKKGIRYQLKDMKSDSELNGQIIEFSETKKLTSLDDPNDDKIEISNGTDTNELLDVLIDRVKYLNEKHQNRELALTITKLEEASLWFNKSIKE